MINIQSIFRAAPIYALALLSLFACASYEYIDSVHPPHSDISSLSTQECNDEGKLLDAYERGWTPCSTDAARATFEYAQMSFNVYHGEIQFDLGPNLKSTGERETLDSGLTYEVFKRQNGEEITEIIIAFRGTNFTSLDDWFFGNIGTRQRKEGLQVFQQVYQKYGIKPSVTGHSLGGAIATQVALCHDVNLSMVFHTSSRFSRHLCRDVYRHNIIYFNHQISIVERGEINKILRAPAPEPTQRYNEVDCLSKGGPIDQHSIGKFAACLTQAAALENALLHSLPLRETIFRKVTRSGELIKAHKPSLAPPLQVKIVTISSRQS